jgi:hypothetical protein
VVGNAIARPRNATIPTSELRPKLLLLADVAFTVGKPIFD